MNSDAEIVTQEATAPKLSFSKRLKLALESLQPGKELKLKTREDRQTITNVVLATKKKMGFNLTTKLLQRRDDEGKIVIKISRLDEPEPIASEATPQ